MNISNNPPNNENKHDNKITTSIGVIVATVIYTKTDCHQLKDAKGIVLILTTKFSKCFNRKLIQFAVTAIVENEGDGCNCWQVTTTSQLQEIVAAVVLNRVNYQPLD